MRTVVIGFGLLVAALLVLFKIGEVQVIRGDVRLEIVVALAALVFFFIGVYFNRSALKAPPAVPAEAKTTSSNDAARKAGLTQREVEVLQKMAEGFSNGEIAATLFLSESTIKTHVSNIFTKLDVKRRTAAVQAAKTLKILA